MFNPYIFFIIITLFIAFILYQVYFYRFIYKKNEKFIKKIESFKNTLHNIDSNNEYILDDASIEILLEDYNKLKNNV